MTVVHPSRPVVHQPLVLRVDASPQMGTGHLMRSIALGQAWRGAGGRVIVATACREPRILERLGREGFEVHGLPPSWPQEPDPGDLQAVLAKASGALVALDGYHFGPRYLEAQRGGDRKVILVDDMAHLEYYDVDLIVNPNAHAASLAYRTPATTRLLLGPAYVLLRREFDKLASARRRSPPVARRLLVTLGGADPHDMTSRVLRAIRRLGKPDLEVTVVIGAANPRVAALTAQVSALPGPTHVVVGADDMAAIYASADLAVSAGGTSVWELAHAGTPSLLLETGPSERMLLSGLKTIGLFEQIGDMATAGESAIAERIAARLPDGAWRSEMATRGRRAVDGRGRSRVLAAMAALGQRPEAAPIGHAVPRLALRPARTGDRERLWLWANDPEVRQVSFHGAPIPWEDHVQWLDARLNDGNCRMYIGLVGDVPAGVVRFQRAGSIAEISVAIAAEYRGQRIGPRLIKLASDRYLKETDVERVDAIVKADNERSIRAFRDAGFSLPAQGHSSPRSPSGAVGMVLPR